MQGYASAKAGLLGLTHSQAVSLAGRCRVNAILPGESRNVLKYKRDTCLISVWYNKRWFVESAGYIYTEDEDPDKALSKEDHDWHLTGTVTVQHLLTAF